jgi:hypothetical protein
VHHDEPDGARHAPLRAHARRRRQPLLRRRPLPLAQRSPGLVLRHFEGENEGVLSMSPDARAGAAPALVQPRASSRAVQIRHGGRSWPWRRRSGTPWRPGVPVSVGGRPCCR